MASTSVSAKGSSGYGDLGNATIPSQQGVAEKNRNPEIREHVSHHFHVQQSRQTMHQDYKGALRCKVARRNTSWCLPDGLDTLWRSHAISLEQGWQLHHWPIAACSFEEDDALMC